MSGLHIIDSPVFGESRVPDEASQEVLNKMVDACPVAVFQRLNKNLNARKMCLMVGAIDQSKEENRNGISTVLPT